MMPYATDSALTLFNKVCQLLDELLVKKPVRRVGVALSKLLDGDSVSLIYSNIKQQDDRQLGEAMDVIKARFGKTAIFRASSLLPSGQAMELEAKIGSHYK